MYPHINQVIISGRLTKDPESKYFSTGNTKATLNVAVNNRRKVGDNYENNPAFIIVECWGKTAEAVCERARKGQPVVFTGQVIQDKYEKDGKTVMLLKFTAHNISVLPEDRDENRTPPRQQPTQTQPQDNDDDGWDDDIGF